MTEDALIWFKFLLWRPPFCHVRPLLCVGWRLNPAGIIPLSWCGSDYVRVKRCGTAAILCTVSAALLLFSCCGFLQDLHIFLFLYKQSHIWCCEHLLNLLRGAGESLREIWALVFVHVCAGILPDAFIFCLFIYVLNICITVGHPLSGRLAWWWVSVDNLLLLYQLQ